MKSFERNKKAKEKIDKRKEHNIKNILKMAG